MTRGTRTALSVPGGRVELMQPHDQAGVLEAVIACTSCGAHIAVGPFFDHIDRATYVGVVCGCFERLNGPVAEWTAAPSSEPSVAAGTAGNGQQTATHNKGRRTA